MTNSNKVFTAIIAFLVLGGGFFLSQNNSSDLAGATPGSDFYQKAFFFDGLVDGGGVYATTTTVATETLTASVLDRSKVIRFLGSATAAAITATLPASTTFPLKNPGDYRTWVIENGYTAAATTTTIAAGTGVDLQEPDGQNVVIGINNYAFLTCFKEASTDVVCSVDETIPAD
jgi:hypothetical protein